MFPAAAEQSQAHFIVGGTAPDPHPMAVAGAQVAVRLALVRRRASATANHDPLAAALAQPSDVRLADDAGVHHDGQLAMLRAQARHGFLQRAGLADVARQH